MEAYSDVFMELEFHTIIIIIIIIYLFFFLSLIAPYLIFYKSSFSLKLDFDKIELQKMSISLISLGKGAKCWIVFLKMAKANFVQKYDQRAHILFHTLTNTNGPFGLKRWEGKYCQLCSILILFAPSLSLNPNRPLIVLGVQNSSYSWLLNLLNPPPLHTLIPKSRHP